MKVPTTESDAPRQAEIQSLRTQIEELQKREAELVDSVKMCFIHAKWNRGSTQWEMRIDQGMDGHSYIGVGGTVEEAFKATLKGFREIDETEES